MKLSEVVWSYAVARMREASTWRSLILLATAMGITVSPVVESAVIQLGLGLAGMVGALLPDRLTIAGDENSSSENEHF